MLLGAMEQALSFCSRSGDREFQLRSALVHESNKPRTSACTPGIRISWMLIKTPGSCARVKVAHGYVDGCIH